MNQKRILQQKEGRAAVVDAAIELDKMFRDCASTPEDREALWYAATSIVEDPSSAEGLELEPAKVEKARELARQIGAVHHELAAKTRRYGQGNLALSELGDLEQNFSADELQKLKRAEANVFDAAAEYRTIEDRIERTWGRKNYGDAEVRHRISELINEAESETMPVAWLRKRAELEQSTFDVAISKLELLKKLEADAGELWDEQELNELFRYLVEDD